MQKAGGCKNCALYKTWLAKEEERCKVFHKELDRLNETYDERTNMLERGACDDCEHHRFLWDDARCGAEQDLYKLQKMEKKVKRLVNELEDLKEKTRDPEIF